MKISIVPRGKALGVNMTMPDEVTESKTVYAAIAGAGRALGYVCAPSMFQKVIAATAFMTGTVELSFPYSNPTMWSLR